MRNLILLLAALPLMALDNSATVINASGADQTNLHTTHGRYFAEGVFAES